MRPPALPHILRCLLLAACGLLIPMAVSAVTPIPDSLCRGDDLAFAAKAEALIVAGVDAERAKLAPDALPLRPDSLLTRIARARSCDMAHGGDFSHTDAKGHFIAGDMVRQNFGRYHTVGENITKLGDTILEGIGATRPFGPEEFAAAAVDAWIKSPEHRANILNPRYHASGIGVAMVDGEAVATQVFGGP